MSLFLSTGAKISTIFTECLGYAELRDIRFFRLNILGIMITEKLLGDFHIYHIYPYDVYLRNIWHSQLLQLSKKPCLTRSRSPGACNFHTASVKRRFYK